jgi:hypothetical protein
MNRTVGNFARSPFGVPASFAVTAPARRFTLCGRRIVFTGITTATVVAGIAMAPLPLAAPAHADASATVKTRTQRMADANLGSQQNGWYNAGDQVTLVCSRRGQNVKGFFSFNIPGGWDNLWYKTGDGNFVADVDIETGTLNDVASDCGNGGGGTAQPPAQSSSKVDAALARANSMVGTDNWGELGCMHFVAYAYGVGATGYNTPVDFWAALDRQGRTHKDGSPAPRGALVFSTNSLTTAGHIDIAQGDGTFVSGGVKTGYRGLAGAGHNIQVMSTPDPTPGSNVLGWADAPW